jgi:hypothetical protein
MSLPHMCWFKCNQGLEGRIHYRLASRKTTHGLLNNGQKVTTDCVQRTLDTQHRQTSASFLQVLTSPAR